MRCPLVLRGMESSTLDDEEPTMWHAYWQAVVGRDFISRASLIRQIRSRLLGAHRKRGRELLYYLVLPSEIHLISSLPKGDSLASLANGLSNVIARRVRQADGTLGAVFRDRYHAQRIEGVELLRGEVRMLAWRPISTGRSNSPSNYAHSALRVILGLSLAEGFLAAPLLDHLGGSVPLGRLALRQELASQPSDLEVLRWELAKGLAAARGSVGPAGAMARNVSGPAAALVAASSTKSIEGALGLLELWVVARLGLPPLTSLGEQRGFLASRARALVASLAVQSGLCPASSVARHFGRAKATVSEQMTALRNRPADKAILAMSMDRIVGEAVELAMHWTKTGGHS